MEKSRVSDTLIGPPHPPTPTPTCYEFIERRDRREKKKKNLGVAPCACRMWNVTTVTTRNLTIALIGIRSTMDGKPLLQMKVVSEPNRCRVLMAPGADRVTTLRKYAREYRGGIHYCMINSKGIFPCTI